MAYPATYNINYYRGDTLEFRVFPKTADGQTWSLLSELKSAYYQDEETTELNSGSNYYFENAGFWVSTSRGTSGLSNRHQCYAQVSDDGTYIQCAIRPGDAVFFEPGTTYVYDVEVRNSSAPYDKVYTLLTGTITVTDQVTGAF